MPTYLHPGVYIEEIPSGAKPIEGVSTSVTAFVGSAQRGPAGEANLIQKLDDYTAQYGDIASEDDDIQDLLRGGMTFNEDAALYIVLQAARAIEYMRSQNILHRDIKPGNIMLKHPTGKPPQSFLSDCPVRPEPRPPSS